MDALLAVALLFLPAILYFAVSPFRPTNVDILIVLMGMLIGLTVLGYVGRWLLPREGQFWLLGIGWLAMCAYAWRIAARERARYGRPERKKSRAER